MLKDLIKKLETWRDYAKENQCSGLKEHVVYEKILREVKEVQINDEIRNRIRMENLSMAVSNYFIKQINEGNHEVDVVDCNADIQKLIREHLDVPYIE